jgi:hypothetical protein
MGREILMHSNHSWQNENGICSCIKCDASHSVCGLKHKRVHDLLDEHETVHSSPVKSDE